MNFNELQRILAEVDRREPRPDALREHPRIHLISYRNHYDFETWV